MSIGNTHPVPAPPDAALPVLLEEDIGDREAADESPLSRVTGSAAFSSILPRLQAALDQMDQPGAAMLDVLTDNITRLQDSFMESLYAGLKEMNADLSAKLTLRLDEQANLTVAGEHPDCEVISALLSRHPEFSAAFTEIAAQSAALRDLRSLRTMVLYASSAHSYSVLASGPGETVYQVSLKGDMNHFYFTR